MDEAIPAIHAHTPPALTAVFKVHGVVGVRMLSREAPSDRELDLLC